MDDFRFKHLLQYWQCRDRDDSSSHSPYGRRADLVARASGGDYSDDIHRGYDGFVIDLRTNGNHYGNAADGIFLSGAHPASQ